MVGRSMRVSAAAWLMIFGVVALGGCVGEDATYDDFQDDEDDDGEGCFFESPAPRGPACETVIEHALDGRSTAFGFVGTAPGHRWGEMHGEVTRIRDRRLTLSFGPNDERAFTWPRALPFPISEGDSVVSNTSSAATTYSFPHGELWVHAVVGFSGPGQDMFEVGVLQVGVLHGCQSNQGLTVDPVVVATNGKPTRVLAGHYAQVEGWTFYNHGATTSPGETRCDMVMEGHYFGVWTAEYPRPGTTD